MLIMRSNKTSIPIERLGAATEEISLIRSPSDDPAPSESTYVGGVGVPDNRSSINQERAR